MKTCGICYEKINKKYWTCKQCSNKLHINCLEQWLNFDNICPYCRFYIHYTPNYIINNAIIYVFIIAFTIKLHEIILIDIYEDHPHIYEFQYGLI